MTTMDSNLQSPCFPGLYVPQGLLLQWHVTERCNLRCAHCYQTEHGDQELPLTQLLEILRQYKELLNRSRQNAKARRVRGHITVTGGEPFVRRDFFDLLSEFHANRKSFSFAILTNGSLIDAALARRLRRLKPAFVQVSIEGTRATHDQIRGPGNFDRTVAAVKHLVRAGLRTIISFTASRQNYREFPQVARLGRELRVARVWADRLIPCGSGEAMRDQMLTQDETREFFQLMRRAGSETPRRWFGQTEIAMSRALQFLVSGGTPYQCTAGDSLITVQANGDLYPCRRMPIRVGNLLETPLAELYYESELFRALRDRQRVSNGCEPCMFKRLCRGGLKCLSHAVTGDPFTADPGCWLRTSQRQATLVHVSNLKLAQRGAVDE